VIKFQHQPISITYKDKSQKSRKYTPDVFVEFEGGIRGLFEIKYADEVLENGKKYEERCFNKLKTCESSFSESSFSERLLFFIIITQIIKIKIELYTF
jgi:hypothetical protein